MHVTKVPPDQPALSDTLSVILPAPEQTWLLRACLYSGELGRQAWEAWRERVGDLKATLGKDKGSFKALAPLLLMALRRNSVGVDSSLLTYLRTAYLREDLRSKIYHRILRSVLSALTAGGVSPIVLKGAALGETVYGDLALRHSHDIDILMEESDLFIGARQLSSLGFTLSGEESGAGQDHVKLTHESGLPLELHSRLFRIPYYRAPLADMRARNQAQVIAGIQTRILSPADNLLHVCGLASCSGSNESLRWVCDAWHIISRHPNLDWDVFLDCALRSNLALPLSVTLGYLAKGLNAPIPATLLDRLSVAASRTDAIGREAALFAALAATRGELKGLIRMTDGWGSRARVIAWMFFPSASHLRWTYHVRHAWLLPFYYVYRPLKYIANRIWWSWRRRTRGKGLQRDLLSAEVLRSGS